MAASSFRSAWHLRLPSLLDATTLAQVQAEVARQEFARYEHSGVGIELTQRASRAVHRLVFLLSDRRVLDLVARIARVPRLGSFRGRLYRMEAGADHHDDWHDDICDTRVVALTLNVGAPHAGGTLLMRRKDDEHFIAIPNTTPGDAVLFRLDESLQHRVTNVESDAPKTAFAGWFCVEPDFEAQLRDARDRA
jgi:hypothetical protein